MEKDQANGPSPTSVAQPFIWPDEINDKSLFLGESQAETPKSKEISDESNDTESTNEPEIPTIKRASILPLKSSFPSHFFSKTDKVETTSEHNNVLVQNILHREWDKVKQRLISHEYEATMPVSLLCFSGGSARALHVACALRPLPPAHVIGDILKAFPDAAKTPDDEWGLLPLHFACSLFSRESSMRKYTKPNVVIEIEKMEHLESDQFPLKELSSIYSSPDRTFFTAGDDLESFIHSPLSQISSKSPGAALDDAQTPPRKSQTVVSDQQDVNPQELETTEHQDKKQPTKSPPMDIPELDDDEPRLARNPIEPFNVTKETPVTDDIACLDEPSPSKEDLKGQSDEPTLTPAEPEKENSPSKDASVEEDENHLAIIQHLLRVYPEGARIQERFSRMLPIHMAASTSITMDGKVQLSSPKVIQALLQAWPETALEKDVWDESPLEISWRGQKWHCPKCRQEGIFQNERCSHMDGVRLNKYMEITKANEKIEYCASDISSDDELEEDRLLSLDKFPSSPLTLPNTNETASETELATTTDNDDDDEEEEEEMDELLTPPFTMLDDLTSNVVDNPVIHLDTRPGHALWIQVSAWKLGYGRRKRNKTRKLPNPFYELFIQEEDATWCVLLLSRFSTRK